MDALLDETRLRAILKDVVLEALDDRRAMFEELAAEAVEDFMLSMAISEGRNTEPVRRSEVFELLRGQE